MNCNLRMKKGSVSIRCSVGLWVVLALIMVRHQSWASQNQSCVSSCGKISNISHPFRMKGSPDDCGDPRYELECVNDVTVLRLSQAAEYRVQAINYKNYTIRLVDPNIQEADCSSAPRYFLYRFNFSDSTPNDRVPPRHWDVDLYHATQMRASESEYTPGQPEYVPLFEHILYMSCNSTVSQYSSRADDDASCLDLHTLVVVGDLHPYNWKPGCHVKVIAPTSGLFQLQQQDPYMGYQPDYELEFLWDRMNPTQSISYSDIHKALAYGFELSWLHATCENHCGSRPCFFNQISQKVLCYDYPVDFPLCGLRRSCRKKNIF